jgi:phosphatidylinositol alpha-mannosyltransferase
VAVSDAAAAFLRRVIRGRIEVVPNGVDIDRFSHPGPRPEGLPAGRIILWVSRLDPQKGFPVMVRAFHRVALGDEDVWLVVVGEGRDRTAIDLLPEGLRERVLMLGAIPNEELHPYHGVADVFAAAATGQESFGYILVEALAAGVPVVATDIPGYREVVRDGIEGLLVPPHDPAALAGALGRVLEEPDLARGLVAAGRERARAFSWDEVAPRLEEVYGRAVAAAR